MPLRRPPPPAASSTPPPPPPLFSSSPSPPPSPTPRPPSTTPALAPWSTLSRSPSPASPAASPPAPSPAPSPSLAPPSPASTRATSASLGPTSFTPSSSPSPLPSPSPSPLRLWRPAAQRNLRNQWSKLVSGKDRWLAAASEGRSHATDLVNAYLHHKYMPSMDLGALTDMPGIRQKASEKLMHKQELRRSMLLSSYKGMVAVVTQLVKAAGSMRCYAKSTGTGSLIQFCDHPEDESDSGDGGGIPVFSFFSIPQLEKLAQELVDMFLLELSVKRLLVTELISISCKGEKETNFLEWPSELYIGEFDDLKAIGLLSQDSFEPLRPRIKDWQPSCPVTEHSSYPINSEVLQVYLTTWFADININMNRLGDICNIAKEEMQIQLS